MPKARRKGRFSNFCKLPLSVPKECLPLLDALNEKGPEYQQGRAGSRGYVLLMALKLMDQHTPFGYFDGPDLRVIPNDPPESQSPRSHLRLI